MLSSPQQRQIELATVALAGLDGRGVLIPGNLILTAAHCVTYKTDGAMVLGDFFIEEVRTSHGALLKARPVFLDPLTDIALLGALESQNFPQEEDAYTAWCDQTPPVSLSSRDFPFDTPFPVQVYTHLEQWITGTVRQMQYEAAGLVFMMTTQIEKGTSGSPVITDDGLIVGVVSNFTSNETGGSECTGLIHKPHLTLPVWALRQIDAREDDEVRAAARMAWYGWSSTTE